MNHPDDGNLAALNTFLKHQEEQPDPDEVAYELQQDLSWPDFLEAIGEISFIKGDQLLTALRLGRERDLHYVGLLVGEAVEDWAIAKAKEEA